jgi:hypothetical protein
MSVAECVIHAKVQTSWTLQPDGSIIIETDDGSVSVTLRHSANTRPQSNIPGQKAQWAALNETTFTFAYQGDEAECEAECEAGGLATAKEVTRLRPHTSQIQKETIQAYSMIECTKTVLLQSYRKTMALK